MSAKPCNKYFWRPTCPSNENQNLSRRLIEALRASDRLELLERLLARGAEMDRLARRRPELAAQLRRRRATERTTHRWSTPADLHRGLVIGRPGRRDAVRPQFLARERRHP